MIEFLMLLCVATIAAVHGWFLWRFLENDRRMRREEEAFVARLKSDQERVQAFLADMKTRKRAEDPRA